MKRYLQFYVWCKTNFKDLILFLSIAIIVLIGNGYISIKTYFDGLLLSKERIYYRQAIAETDSIRMALQPVGQFERMKAEYLEKYSGIDQTVISKNAKQNERARTARVYLSALMCKAKEAGVYEQYRTMWSTTNAGVVQIEQ